MWSSFDWILLIICFLAALLAAAVTVRLLAGWQRIRWDAVPAGVQGPIARLTVIIPARNEEPDLEAALQSVLRQTGVDLEVIIVNDHSTDRTGPIAEAAARADSRVRVIHDPPLPPGWLGKANAMQQAAAVAAGDYLLFTDADILHGPNCFATALAEFEQQKLDFLSLFPLLRCVSLWESVLTPGFAWRIMLHLTAPGVRDGSGADAQAAGAFMLVRRTAFQAVGGFEQLKSEMLDDVGLARLLQRSGCRVGVRAAPQLLQVRLFKSGTDAFWGPTKNILSALRGRMWRAPVVMVWPMLVFWTPLLCVAVGAWQGNTVLLLTGAGTYLLQYASLWPSRRLYRFHPARALLFPLAPLSVICCFSRAVYHYLVHGTILWRGRAVKVRGSSGLT